MESNAKLIDRIAFLTDRCEMLDRSKAQLEALAQMHRRMYAEAGPALGSVLAEEMNRALERIEQAKGTIDAQLFDYRSEILDEIEPTEEESAPRSVGDKLADEVAELCADEDLDALPILCDCGMEWDPSIYSECPDCAEEIEVATCSTCHRIFEAIDEPKQSGCPSCKHDDRIYHRPISRGSFRKLVADGDALEATKAVR